MYIQVISAFHFGMPEQRMKVVDFDICQNAKKIIGYHSNVHWATVKLMTYLSCKVDKDRSSNCYDIQSDRPIFAVLSKNVQLLPSQSLGLLDQLSPKSYKKVEKFILFNILK